MKSLRWGLVCVTHVNKSSPVFSVGSAISSLPFGFPSHLCSLGLFAQLWSCLASFFNCFSQKFQQLPASLPFLRRSGWLQGETQCRNTGQGRRWAPLCSPLRQWNALAFVSAFVLTLAQCPGFHRGDPRAALHRCKSHGRRQWENHENKHAQKRVIAA